MYHSCTFLRLTQMREFSILLNELNALVFQQMAVWLFVSVVQSHGW